MKKLKEKGTAFYCCYFGFSWIAAIVLNMTWAYWRDMAELQPILEDFIENGDFTLLQPLFPLWGFLILWPVLCVVNYLVIFYGKEIGNFIFRFRYLIALALFIGCVFMELHGSSFNEWLHWLPEESLDRELILGQTRAIRSDEWAVFTPLVLAQEQNPFGAYSYFSTIPRGTLTDCFAVYGQPVRDLAILFRPFQIGYLFLDTAKGMSFFWCGRLIALFLVSLEVGMLITGRKKLLSSILAWMITLSPMVQWWFAINGLVEMLIFGQLAVLFVYHYIRTRQYWVRFLLMIGVAWCGEIFIFTLYPAWMVPLGYLYLVLLIWIWKENKAPNWFHTRKDGILILLFTMIFVAGIFYIVLKSQDAISLVLDSAYPGERISRGGEQPWMPWISNMGIILPYRIGEVPVPFLTSSVPECEAAFFMDFFPIGILIAFYVIFCQKKRDVLLIGLLVLDVLLSIFSVIELPEWLARITLLNFSSSPRTTGILSFVRLIELFRALGLYQRKSKNGVVIEIGIGIILAAVLAGVNQWLMPEYVTGWYLIEIFLMLTVVYFLVLRSGRKGKQAALAFALFIVTFYAGAMINPVQKGLAQVSEHPLLQKIREINQRAPGIWVTEGMGFPYAEIPLVAGVSTRNCTNVYPNLEQWRLLDPEHTQEDIYNRYAHIQINLTEEPTGFVLNGIDNFFVNINPNNLSALGANYFISPNELERFNTEQGIFQRIDQIGGYLIYQWIAASP